MKRAFVRPKVVGALTGLVLAIGLAVIPAQAADTPRYAKPASTGAIGGGAAPGGAVTREQIIDRAQHWVDTKVQYSQSSWHRDQTTGGHYRQDCSGFVSMAWQLRDSLTTRSLPDFATPITWDQLQPGDALNSVADGHVILFAGWTDKAKGTFRYMSESRPGQPARAASANRYDRELAGHPRTGYTPLRYNNLAGARAKTGAPAAT